MEKSINFDVNWVKKKKWDSKFLELDWHLKLGHRLFFKMTDNNKPEVFTFNADIQ